MAALVHYFGDLELAEDSLQDAVEKALNRWPADGVPNKPDAWLLQVAKRTALNVLKRSKTYERKKAELVDRMHVNGFSDPPDAFELDAGIPDERLRLIFTCCHPALNLEASVALTLRAIGGLTTVEIANAFIVPESTMAQRLVRAKRKIKAANIPYDVPAEGQWPDRLRSVMLVVYFIFNEGYSSSVGPSVIRGDLCEEAIYLARMIHELTPNEPEAAGLLALMLFHDARRAGRMDENGGVLTLEEQDRTRWNLEMISEADRILTQALHRGGVGEYQLQAAIAGIHAQAKTFDSTDWEEILLLYDTLCSMHPSPVLKLNRAVALSFAAGPVDGLAALGDLEDALVSYLPFHAARGDFLRRLGRHEEAVNAYVQAVKLAGNDAEREFFRRRLAGF